MFACYLHRAVSIAVCLAFSTGLLAQTPAEFSATSATASFSNDKKTLVLAGEDDWSPYSAAEKPGADTDSSPVGFSVDLVRAALASQGIQVKIINVPFARCMLYAKSGQVAGCFNATITDDNRADYVWHQPAMFEEELSIFARADADVPELRLADLRGKRVAYTNGYTYPSEFMHDSRILKSVAVSDAALIRMLLAKRVDYILLNRTPGGMRINNTPEFKGRAKRVGLLSMDGFWVAFSKQHPQGESLAQAFSAGLAQMRRDGSYQRLQDEFRKRVHYR
ncbi:transporter substrate-binding domain-containing protein [Paucibacter sp. TC2R-5]|uniref:substrate-binding periplasmic protein n=1 Tax=Paucibacter sp. TC2R-5 TaxID=2893555 RepID=UPI0021E4F1FD|nr:transporter substrate-binding domain-containing protein [Paucibacter sp. TC2R-5]MCV2360534.1 transporter substrate-binding domain-containing protein [Paucibacter sp. TC2R-5]